MAKRSNKAATNLVLLIISLVTAVVSFIGLACNFINEKTTLVSASSTSHWNLSEWFKYINDMKDFDDIIGWQIARWMLVITTILLVVMLVLLVVNYVLKNKLFKWTTFGVAIAVVVCAAIFMVTTFIGCNTMSSKLIVSSVKYTANIGVYLLGIGAMVSGVLASVMALRK